MWSVPKEGALLSAKTAPDPLRAKQGRRLPPDRACDRCICGVWHDASQAESGPGSRGTDWIYGIGVDPGAGGSRGRGYRRAVETVGPPWQQPGSPWSPRRTVLFVRTPIRPPAVFLPGSPAYGPVGQAALARARRVLGLREVLRLPLTCAAQWRDALATCERYLASPGIRTS